MKAIYVLLAMITIPSAGAAELLDFSGQGIPRETAADCKTAGEALGAKLTARGFEGIALSCAGTSQAIGGFVPVVRAHATRRYTTVQALSGRFPVLAACNEKLGQMAAEIPTADILEKECLRGNELDFLGKSTPYFQPWITRLVLSDDQRRSTTEGDRRESKPLTAEPASAPVGGGSGNQAPVH